MTLTKKVIGLGAVALLSLGLAACGDAMRKADKDLRTSSRRVTKL